MEGVNLGCGRILFRFLAHFCLLGTGVGVESLGRRILQREMGIALARAPGKQTLRSGGRAPGPLTGGPLGPTLVEGRGRKKSGQGVQPHDSFSAPQGKLSQVGLRWPGRYTPATFSQWTLAALGGTWPWTRQPSAAKAIPQGRPLRSAC